MQKYISHLIATGSFAPIADLPGAYPSCPSLRKAECDQLPDGMRQYIVIDTEFAHFGCLLEHLGLDAEFMQS